MARNAAAARNAASTRLKVSVPHCIYFDGVNDYVDLGADFIGTPELTIEVLVKLEGAGGSSSGRILENGKCNLLVAGAGQVYFYSDGATDAISSPGEIALDNSRWDHIIITRTVAGAANIYVNGSLTPSGGQQASGTPAAGTTNVRLGDRVAGARTLDGKMVEFRIWDKILHLDDIAIHFTNARDITCINTAACTYAANCLVHFPMLEGSGIKLVDASGHGRTGSFRGAGEPAWSTDTDGISVLRPTASARSAVA